MDNIKTKLLNLKAQNLEITNFVSFYLKNLV